MRAIFAFAAAVLFTLTLSAADQPPQKITVIATLFPQYDFARQIARDRAGVRLLLPPGAESHSFEPTPSDIKAINNADVFIYTGENMEPWAKQLAAGVTSKTKVVDASHGIKLVETGEHDDDNGDHDHGHSHEYDPHIWLDPVMAGIMVDNIAQALAEKDPDNAAFYLKNSLALGEELDALDHAFAARVAGLPRRLLVFGDRFAFNYFFSRYGLDWDSPYNSCVAGSEPGLRAVIGVIDEIKKEGIKFIYVEAMSTSRMAAVMNKETGAEILSVDSLHNPPLERQTAGISYQSVMKENMDAFARGLE